MEIRLDLSVESCAGSPIFNVGETMFWSARIGIDHGASGHYRDPTLDFISSSRAKSSPRRLRVLFYIRALYTANIYVMQIDMTSLFLSLNVKFFYSQRIILS